MHLELSRARLLQGAEEETERWMEMLHDRYDECLDTLSPGLDLSNPVDAEHDAYARRCKEPGWEELRPVLLLTPRPIRPVLEAWARDGRVESG